MISYEMVPHMLAYFAENYPEIAIIDFALLELNLQNSNGMGRNF